MRVFNVPAEDLRDAVLAELGITAGDLYGEIVVVTPEEKGESPLTTRENDWQEVYVSDPETHPIAVAYYRHDRSAADCEYRGGRVYHEGRVVAHVTVEEERVAAEWREGEPVPTITLKLGDRPDPLVVPAKDFGEPYEDVDGLTHPIAVHYWRMVYHGLLIAYDEARGVVTGGREERVVAHLSPEDAEAVREWRQGGPAPTVRLVPSDRPKEGLRVDVVDYQWRTHSSDGWCAEGYSSTNAVAMALYLTDEEWLADAESKGTHVRLADGREFDVRLENVRDGIPEYIVVEGLFGPRKSVVVEWDGEKGHSSPFDHPIAIGIYAKNNDWHAACSDGKEVWFPGEATRYPVRRVDDAHVEVVGLYLD